jgi:hypothetical protein
VATELIKDRQQQALEKTHMQLTGGMFELIRIPNMLHGERTNCSQIQGNALPAHLNFTMKGGAQRKNSTNLNFVALIGKRVNLFIWGNNRWQ